MGMTTSSNMERDDTPVHAPTRTITPPPDDAPTRTITPPTDELFLTPPTDELFPEENIFSSGEDELSDEDYQQRTMDAALFNARLTIPANQIFGGCHIHRCENEEDPHFVETQRLGAALVGVPPYSGSPPVTLACWPDVDCEDSPDCDDEMSFHERIESCLESCTSRDSDILISHFRELLFVGTYIDQAFREYESHLRGSDMLRRETKFVINAAQFEQRMHVLVQDELACDVRDSRDQMITKIMSHHLMLKHFGGHWDAPNVPNGGPPVDSALRQEFDGLRLHAATVSLKMLSYILFRFYEQNTYWDCRLCFMISRCIREHFICQEDNALIQQSGPLYGAFVSYNKWKRTALAASQLLAKNSYPSEVLKSALDCIVNRVYVDILCVYSYVNGRVMRKRPISGVYKCNEFRQHLEELSWSDKFCRTMRKKLKLKQWDDQNFVRNVTLSRFMLEPTLKRYEAVTAKCLWSNHTFLAIGFVVKSAVERFTSSGRLFKHFEDHVITFNILFQYLTTLRESRSNRVHMISYFIAETFCSERNGMPGMALGGRPPHLSSKTSEYIKNSSASKALWTGDIIADLPFFGKELYYGVLATLDSLARTSVRIDASMGPVCRFLKNIIKLVLEFFPHDRTVHSKVMLVLKAVFAFKKRWIKSLAKTLEVMCCGSSNTTFMANLRAFLTTVRSSIKVDSDTTCCICFQSFDVIASKEVCPCSAGSCKIHEVCADKCRSIASISVAFNSVGRLGKYWDTPNISKCPTCKSNFTKYHISPYKALLQSSVPTSKRKRGVDCAGAAAKKTKS
jgi:hypothetical protein